MLLFSSLCVLLLSLINTAWAKSIAGERLLIVLEDEPQRGLYSKFWADLEGMPAHGGFFGGEWKTEAKPLTRSRIQTVLPVSTKR
jgi:hypothetical protein